MADEDPQNRVTARLVEEGYVSLQDSMRTYRQARNQSNRAAGLDPSTDPVVVLQDAVQTFYELVRPYLKDEPRLSEYWQGAIAQHPERPHATVEQAIEYYREHSVGVWQAQRHTGAVEVAQTQQATLANTDAVADGGTPDTLDGWHSALGLPRSSRVLSVEPAGDDDDLDGYYYREGRFAVVGLREVGSWRVRERTTRDQGDGFMASETSTTTTRDPEPAQKVETAARMLVEVADELGAIVNYEPAGDRIHGTPLPDDS